MLGAAGRYGCSWLALGPWAPARVWRRRLHRIDRHEVALRGSSDAELRRRSFGLRYRAQAGEPLESLLPDAYALMRVAAQRALRQRHYDVQVLGGMALFGRSMVEMPTGEGKTLTATLPLYLAALTGRGAHLATANDYLAERDAAFVRPAFELLGMSVGVVQSSTSRPERQQAYRCDVTYAAAREFGFDFLRDRLLNGRLEGGHRDLLGRMLGQAKHDSGNRPLQQELHFILVDEADSILIDEARTPLIVSTVPGSSPDVAAELFRWAAEMAACFRESRDFTRDDGQQIFRLTEGGRRRVRELPRKEILAGISLYDLYENMERAIRVALTFERDRHYVVRDGEIVIVDENTGRLAEGRRWRDGLHQAIEAREGVPVRLAAGEAARVNVQDYFLRYAQLAGMTGTAWNARHEMRRVYGLQTHVIPTHRPVQRTVWEDRVFATAAQKWDAVIEEVRAVHAAGRPVLIGTRSIEKSERLSGMLTAAGIEHSVLNAHRHAEEAQIVTQAGQRGTVTVATNMAGRGTDIKLGAGVAALGGLHVIGCELHDSTRIDRQLSGRCARQGDAGSFRQFMSLEDEILKTAFGPAKAARWGKRAERNASRRWVPLIRQAQRRVEQRHSKQRRLLLNQEKRRQELQREMGQDPFLDTV